MLSYISNLADYGEKENSELAERYGIKKEDYPEYRLFKQGDLENPLVYRWIFFIIVYLFIILLKFCISRTAAWKPDLTISKRGLRKWQASGLASRDKSKLLTASLAILWNVCTLFASLAIGLLLAYCTVQLTSSPVCSEGAIWTRDTAPKCTGRSREARGRSARSGEYLSSLDIDTTRFAIGWPNLTRKLTFFSHSAQALVYIKTMERLLEKGDDWLGAEQSRVQKLLGGKLGDAKRRQLQLRLNVLTSFAFANSASAAGDASRTELWVYSCWVFLFVHCSVRFSSPLKITSRSFRVIEFSCRVHYLQSSSSITGLWFAVAILTFGCFDILLWRMNSVNSRTPLCII